MDYQQNDWMFFFFFFFSALWGDLGCQWIDFDSLYHKIQTLFTHLEWTTDPENHLEFTVLVAVHSSRTQTLTGCKIEPQMTISPIKDYCMFTGRISIQHACLRGLNKVPDRLLPHKKCLPLQFFEILHKICCFTGCKMDPNDNRTLQRLTWRTFLGIAQLFVCFELGSRLFITPKIIFCHGSFLIFCSKSVGWLAVRLIQMTFLPNKDFAEGLQYASDYSTDVCVLWTWLSKSLDLF